MRQCDMRDCGESRGDVGGGGGVKIYTEYNVHSSGDRNTKSSDLTTVQFIHVTKIHLYPKSS